MPPSDETTKILIQIAGDIGRTREATETLKDNYTTLSENVKEEFKDIKGQLEGMVTATQCENKHRQVSHSMEIVKSDIIEEIKKNSSGTDFPAVTHEMLKAASAPSVQEIEAILEERKEEKKEKRRKVWTFWIAIISTVATLLVGGSVGLYKIVLFASKLENTVTAGTEEVRSEIKKSKNSKIIYVSVPVPVKSNGDDSDTAVPEPVPPRKAPLKKNR